MLPTLQQLDDVQKPLLKARDVALAICVFGPMADENGENASLKRLCVTKLKEAAQTLGFELIERVTPAARDGGRMEVPEGYDA